MPTIHQLSEVFDSLPDEPVGPVKRLGPQYERRNRPRPNQREKELQWYEKLFPFLISKEEDKPYVNPMASLRNGDKALVVAVNDSGNTGWVRFGRTGFAEAAVM
jgi:tRNA-splicing endonuclease subunit Sen54